jgi:hypothetical protein
MSKIKAFYIPPDLADSAGKEDGHSVHEGQGQGMLVGSGNGRAAAAELLQFSLSHPVASVIIGCEQMALLGQNIQAALSFTPASESDKQRLREKIAPSRSAWENFLRTHEDGTVV